MFVIQLSTLHEFVTEVPAPADVRLAQHYITRNGGGPGATRDLCLDLMARRGDEVIWLHEQISLQMTPGQDEPWTENGKAVQAAFPGLVELVRAALTAHRASRWQPYPDPVYRNGQRHLGETVGRGATFLAVANQRGIPWHIVRVWPDGDRELERQLKAQHHAARLCPWCNPTRVPFPGIAVVDWLMTQQRELLRAENAAAAAALTAQAAVVQALYPDARQGLFWWGGGL